MDRLALMYWLLRLGGIIGALLTGRYLWQDYRANRPTDRVMQISFVVSVVLVAASLTDGIAPQW